MTRTARAPIRELANHPGGLRAALSVALAFGALSANPAPAEACSPGKNPPHELDAAQAGDTVAPSAVTATASIGRASDEVGCGETHPCGDLAGITVLVEASDDATPFEKLGYQLRVAGGELPLGMQRPDATVSSSSTLGGQLTFHFDGDDRSGFSFDLEIRARDLNGNLGPPTVLTISEPGDGGCASSHGSLTGALVVLLAVSARRRYRRRA